MALSPTTVATLHCRRTGGDTTVDIGSDMLCDCVREYRKQRRNDRKNRYFVKVRQRELTPEEIKQFIARYPVCAG